jgi:8-oxo-dGTP pyrophosphatase MutT (NUDIX family)
VTRNALGDLEKFLRERLIHPLPGVDAHLRLAPKPKRPGWKPGVIPDDARRAAALILLYPIDDRVHLPLTVRHRTLPHHPGQISLPGGRINAGEAPLTAALREAREEIGVDPTDVRVVGALTPFFILVSNFVIEPFIGISDTRPDFQLDAREVETLIEVPLDELRDPSRVKWGQRTREGFLVDFPYFDVAGQQVWGATAMILAELIALDD